MSKVKIEKVKIDDENIIELVYESPQDALLHMIYLKTGLVFLKPEVGNHPFLPDNLREFQNLMIMLNKMDTVIDPNKNNGLKIYSDKAKFSLNKSILVNNINEFKNYFYKVWIKKSLSREQTDLFYEFKNESVDKKNKFLYRYFKKYIRDNVDLQNQNVLSDNVQSFNISLADIFEIMNSFEDKIKIKNLITAFSMEYSLVAFDIIHLKSNDVLNVNISDLFHGRILEFTKVENDYFNDKNSDLLGDVRSITTHNQRAYGGQNSLRTSSYVNIVLENYIIDENEDIDREIAELYAKSNLETIVKYVVLNMIIYYGYRSDSFQNPIVLLDNKYYVPSYSGRTFKYTLAPSGLFTKIIDIKQFLEAIFNDFSIDDDKSLSKSKIEKVINYIINPNEIERYIDGDEGSFLNLWKYLISNESTEMIPYHSFDFLNVLSSKFKYDTKSRWRRDIFTNHSRFKRHYFDIVGELSNEIYSALSYRVYVSNDYHLKKENINYNSLNYQNFMNVLKNENPLLRFYFLNGKDRSISIYEEKLIESLIDKIKDNIVDFSVEEVTNCYGILFKYLSEDEVISDFNIKNEMDEDEKNQALRILDNVLLDMNPEFVEVDPGINTKSSTDLKSMIRVNHKSPELDYKSDFTRLLIIDLKNIIVNIEPRKVKTQINSFIREVPEEIIQQYDNEINEIEQFKLDYVGLDKRKELVETLTRFSNKLESDIKSRKSGK